MAMLNCSCLAPACPFLIERIDGLALAHTHQSLRTKFPFARAVK
jgi:hypothetical protein